MGRERKREGKKKKLKRGGGGGGQCLRMNGNCWGYRFNTCFCCCLMTGTYLFKDSAPLANNQFQKEDMEGRTGGSRGGKTTS